MLPVSGCSYLRCHQFASAAANNITKESEVRTFEGSSLTKSKQNSQNTASSDGEWYWVKGNISGSFFAL